MTGKFWFFLFYLDQNCYKNKKYTYYKQIENRVNS